MMKDDYGFYGEEESQATRDIEGVTGDVTNYTYTGMTYPCVVFKEGFKCPKHKMTVISHMVKPPSRKKNTSYAMAGDTDSNVGLYFSNQGELYKMGELNGLQIGAFLDLVGTSSVSGYYDESTRLEEDHLYALCTV